MSATIVSEQVLVDAKRVRFRRGVECRTFDARQPAVAIGKPRRPTVPGTYPRGIMSRRRPRLSPKRVVVNDECSRPKSDTHVVSVRYVSVADL